MAGNSAARDEIIASQAVCIENLQQQVYFLENEISYLRTHLEHENQMKPSVLTEAEVMVKKLAESQKQIQNLKVELKRKQTSVDFYKSEKERVSQKLEENEATFYKQKNSLLEELVALKKEKEDYLEKCLELERFVDEKIQQENHLQGECDSLHVQVEELQKELAESRQMVDSLQETKKELQKSVTEARMRLEMKALGSQDEALKLMKAEVEKLCGELSEATRTAEHEKILRSRLADDNENLIKRHAAIEAALSEAKAKLREEQSLRASLEDIHLKVVLDASGTKSELASLTSEADELKQCLKVEKERSLQLSVQVADEQRFKVREEQKVSHLERRLLQKEEKVKARERENTELLRDNAALKDEVLQLKEQLKNRDAEVEMLKRKVQEMHVSVEEFIQNSKAATRLEGQRWKQLTQLAHGIQALSKEAVLDKDV